MCTDKKWRNPEQSVCKAMSQPAIVSGVYCRMQYLKNYNNNNNKRSKYAVPLETMSCLELVHIAIVNWIHATLGGPPIVLAALDIGRNNTITNWRQENLHTTCMSVICHVLSDLLLCVDTHPSRWFLKYHHCLSTGCTPYLLPSL